MVLPWMGRGNTAGLNPSGLRRRVDRSQGHRHGHRHGHVGSMIAIPPLHEAEVSDA